MASKLPQAGKGDVENFLQEVARTPISAVLPGGKSGRLLFAMDATASRKPTWDMAAQIQNEMFRETTALGGLDVQLVYYKGFLELYKSKWQSSASGLGQLMSRVNCAAGTTQITRVLSHALKETAKNKIHAIVFVGDALEENLDELAHQAGLLGVQGVPVFMFHEGINPMVQSGFQQIAKLSGGAYCRFDTGSAGQLKDLLSAVAVYAAGGKRALIDYGTSRGNAGNNVLQLTRQIKASS